MELTEKQLTTTPRYHGIIVDVRTDTVSLPNGGESVREVVTHPGGVAILPLTDEEDVPEAVARLRVIYPNLMKLSYDNTRTRTNQLIDGAQEVQRKSPLELFDELYELQNNQPMSDEQRSFAGELIESIWEGSV
jgi:hypothetical protein